MGAPAAQARADRVAPRGTRRVRTLAQQHGRTVLILHRAAITAGAFAVAGLIAGCGGSSSTATGANPGDGKKIFVDAGCAGCHTLKAAGSDGGAGPELTNINLSAAAVAKQVENGGGGMPGFSGDLTDQQIKAVSEFVAANDGSK
jgi:mono/diheme cytochrome c family protein